MPATCRTSRRRGTSGPVNEGQTVADQRQERRRPRRRPPAAPGALAAGRADVQRPAGTGAAPADRQRGDDPVLPAAPDRRSTGTHDPARPGRRPGRAARRRASSRAARSAGFDTKYDAGEILLDPGDRADVVAAIPADARPASLTLWTRTSSAPGRRRLRRTSRPSRSCTSTSPGRRARALHDRRRHAAARRDRRSGRDCSARRPDAARPGDVRAGQAGHGRHRGHPAHEHRPSTLGINGDHRRARRSGRRPTTRDGRPHIDVGAVREARRHAGADGHEHDRRAPSVPPARLLDPAASTSRKAAQSPTVHVPVPEFRDNIDVPAGYTLRSGSGSTTGR